MWLGQRSYGVYLYHYPIAKALVEPHLGFGPAALAVTLILSLIVAGVSFRYLETPFLRLKRRRVAAQGGIAAVAA